jgi:hypothetical protein
MVQQIRQVPIFDSANKGSVHDFGETVRLGIASNERAIDRATDLRREDKAIQDKATKEAAKSVSELQAQAHFGVQKIADQKIKDLQKRMVEYEGDRTSPEFQVDIVARGLGEIANINKRSADYVAMLPELDKKAEGDEYNTAAIKSNLQDILFNPESFGSFKTIQEDLDELYYNNFDENIAIKKGMEEQYGIRDITRELESPGAGKKSEESFNMSAVFDGFDEDGTLHANRDLIDIKWWEENQPDVMRKIRERLNDPNEFGQIVKSIGTRTPQAMEKELLAIRMEQLGQLQLDVKRNNISALDQEKLRTQEAITDKTKASIKSPIEYNLQFQKFTDGMINGDLAKAAKATGADVSEIPQRITKSEAWDKAVKKADMIRSSKTATDEEKKDALAKVKESMDVLSKFGNDDDVVAMRVGKRNFEPTGNSIKQMFIGLMNQNFGIEDKKNLLNEDDFEFSEEANAGIGLFADRYNITNLKWDVLDEAVANIYSSGVSSDSSSKDDEEEPEISEEEADELLNKYFK